MTDSIFVPEVDPGNLEQSQHAYFLTISFDGGNYRGWQRQADAVSVQQVLEEKLTAICKEFVCVHGCGRTDAGVHASFYVAHIHLPDPLSFDLKFRLNKHLPKDIVVYDVIPVDICRHARFDAMSRTYDYYLHLYPDPMLYRYSSQYDTLSALDFDAMRRAMEILPRHGDFRAVCKQPRVHDSTVCTVFAAQMVTDAAHTRVKFTISANRFLRGMVRLLVAHVLKIGMGEMSVEDFNDLLTSQVQRAEIIPAHPNGLYLSNIQYPFLLLDKRAHFTDVLNAGMGVNSPS